MKKASLPPAVLASVKHQPPKPLGDSPYHLRLTTLTFRGITLQQLTSFLYDLTDGTPWTVRDLQLRAAGAKGAENRWDAEATLSFLIYASKD